MRVQTAKSLFPMAYLESRLDLRRVYTNLITRSPNRDRSLSTSVFPPHSGFIAPSPAHATPNLMERSVSIPQPDLFNNAQNYNS